MTTTDPRGVPGALCAEVDPELFFPLKGDNPHAAKKVCKGDERPGGGKPPRPACPLLLVCREFALDPDNDVRDGVWGGMTEQERRKERKRRGRSRKTHHNCGPRKKGAAA